MNKLLLNHRARNHIKFQIVSESIKQRLNYPEDEAGQINWCKDRFNQLQNGNTKRLFLAKHKGKGYMITVWVYDGMYYIVECLRNEFKTFNTTIFINDNMKDSVAIAKFLENNINQIMADYKNQILEARDALIKARLEEQDRVVGEADGDA